MKLTTVKGALVQKVNSIDPKAKVYGLEIQDGFKRPAFFIQLTPFGLKTAGKFHTAKSINVDVQYFGPNQTDFENLSMTDSLSDIFTKVVPIEDRNLLPENIEVEVIDKVLHFKFDLKFLDTSDALILDDVNNVPASRIVAMSFCEPRSCRLQLSS